MKPGEGSVSADRDPSSVAHLSMRATSPTRGEGEKGRRLQARPVVLRRSRAAAGDAFCQLLQLLPGGILRGGLEHVPGPELGGAAQIGGRLVEIVLRLEHRGACRK